MPQFNHSIQIGLKSALRGIETEEYRNMGEKVDLVKISP